MQSPDAHQEARDPLEAVALGRQAPAPGVGWLILLVAALLALTAVAVMSFLAAPETAADDRDLEPASGIQAPG